MSKKGTAGALLLASAISLSCDGAPPEVTADNFRTLTFEQSGGIAALHSVLSIEAGGRAEYRLAGGGSTRVQSEQLSPETFLELLAVLNRNQALTLAGSYRQSGADLFEETFRLVTDEGTAEVRNQGERAPRRYLNVRDYLTELTARVFSGS
jgi:hypothetical protein